MTNGKQTKAGDFYVVCFHTKRTNLATLEQGTSLERMFQLSSAERCKAAKKHSSIPKKTSKSWLEFKHHRYMTQSALPVYTCLEVARPDLHLGAFDGVVVAFPGLPVHAVSVRRVVTVVVQAVQIGGVASVVPPTAFVRHGTMWKVKFSVLWCNISGKAAGKMWHWSLSRMKRVNWEAVLPLTFKLSRHATLHVCVGSWEISLFRSDE